MRTLVRRSAESAEGMQKAQVITLARRDITRWLIKLPSTPLRVSTRPAQPRRPQGGPKNAARKTAQRRLAQTPSSAAHQWTSLCRARSTPAQEPPTAKSASVPLGTSGTALRRLTRVQPARLWRTRPWTRRIHAPRAQTAAQIHAGQATTKIRPKVQTSARRARQLLPRPRVPRTRAILPRLAEYPPAQQVLW